MWTRKKNMTCEGNGCWFTEPAKPSYSWWQDTELTIVECKFHNLSLTAEHSDSFIFNKECRPTDLSCQLHDSMVVWTKRNIHYCPFKRIMHKVNFKIELDGFTSFEHNLNFVFHQTETHCNSRLIKTVEGLYIKFSNLHDDNFYEKTGSNDFTEINIAEITEMTLASLDFVSKMENKLQKDSFDLSCKIFQNSIHMLTKTQSNEFVRIQIPKRNDTFFFISNGFVYQPTCIVMKYLKVMKSLRNCDTDIEVEVSRDIQGKYVKGWLTSEGIIIPKYSKNFNNKTESKSCRSLRQIFYLDGKNALVRENDRTRIVKLKEINQETFNFATMYARVTVNHSNVLAEEFNMYKQIELDSTVNEILPENFHDESSKHTTKTVNKLVEFVNKACKALFWILIISSFIIVTSYLIYLCVDNGIFNFVFQKIVENEVGGMELNEISNLAVNKKEQSDYSILYEFYKNREKNKILK